MKIFVGDEEKEFFKKNGLILFEGVLSEEEVDTLRVATEGVSCEKTSRKDMAMADNRIAKVLFSKKVASIAFELSGKHALRYAYDQFFSSSLLPHKLSTSISPLRIGVCIALDSQEEGVKEDIISFKMRCSDLPTRKGDVLFFVPEVELGIESSMCSGSFFFLLYASDRAMYIFQPDDPYTHDVKRLGYVFGDRVKEETHPVLYR